MERAKNRSKEDAVIQSKVIVVKASAEGVALMDLAPCALLEP